MTIATIPDKTTVKTQSPSKAQNLTHNIETRLEEFVNNDYRRVVATVSLWCGSIDDASQAVADAFGRTWEQLNKGQHIDNLAAFITTSAMNRVRTSHRGYARFLSKRHLLATTPTQFESIDDRIDCARALKQLGLRQQKIVALHYGADLTTAQIASRLGVAEGTVKATLHSARSLLAALLAPYDEGIQND